MAVLVPPTTPMHLSVHDTAVHMRSKHEAEEALAKKSEAYLTSVGEWWLMSLCNYIIFQVAFPFMLISLIFKLFIQLL